MDTIDCQAVGQKFGFDKQGYLVAQLWEFQEENDFPVFGCLNPACKIKLEETMSTAIVMSISYILKLVFVTLFSVGLGAHTVRFNFH